MHESERVELARSLHDGIAQDLIGLSYRLQTLLADERTPLHMRAQLRDSIFEIGLLSTKVRDEIFALRHKPRSISFGDLKDELSQGAIGISLLFEGALADQSLFHWPLLEICQELIRNARTHAGATRIVFAFSSEEHRYRCIVVDDGPGEIAAKKGHYGLIGIKELLLTFGGEITIEREGSKRITLTFPIFHA